VTTFHGREEDIRPLGVFNVNKYVIIKEKVSHLKENNERKGFAFRF